MPPKGWKSLVADCPFRGHGKYPVEAYSEFMPSVKLGCAPYGERTDSFFSGEDRYGFPVTEFEEHYELRPGLENIGHQVMNVLLHLIKGDVSNHLAKNKLAGNPYWPSELADRAKALTHERMVLIMPLSLSITQDDKGRRRWTFFGGSEQGPARPFWKSFFTSPKKEIPAARAMGRIGAILNAAFGETSDLNRAGFRIFAKEGDPQKALRPSWADSFILTNGMSLQGVKYLLNFEPFGNLPDAVRSAYIAGKLHLLPFPGSLLFWGVPGYNQMQRELPMSNQMPLLGTVERHEAPCGLRVPQAGWIHVQHPDHPSPHEGVGPMRETFRRTHRWARVHRHEDELAIPGRMEHVIHVLFSTTPDDLGLYGKPMARNCQIWTHDYRLLLDGPNAARADIENAVKEIKQGGTFGYRFQYPPMNVGIHQIYWQRPLVACLPLHAENPAVIPDALLGYLTAYDARQPDLDQAGELWPGIYRRTLPTEAMELCKDKKHEHKTVTRVLNLLDAHEHLRVKKLPRSFAGRIVMLPEDKTLERWMDHACDCAGRNDCGKRLGDELRDIIEKEKPRSSVKKALPAALTFSYSARRSFEVQYWNDISYLSSGTYMTKANSDCILDAVTQGRLKHHRRDLEALGDYLLEHYRRVAAECGMLGKALVGDLPFRWKTDFDFNWWGGWANNQNGRAEERNLMVMIPGRDRKRAVIMADHYDTAYMEDIYYKDQGGGGARLASAGADDNHSATAALMRAAPIFCDLSRRKKLGCDVWLIHLTGEEFPSDCMGSRDLSRKLVEGSLKLRLPGGEERDLSDVEIEGIFVLDMIAHNSDNDRDKFQISPGADAHATWLAYQAHIANEIWNENTQAWNRRSSRRGRGRGKRSADGRTIPEIAGHPKLDGQVRMPRDPHSTLYNTDGQVFSDAGIPAVLFMENYDISRKGYHDTHDTMLNIDLDYGAAVAAIAIEAVARAATQKPPLSLRGA